MLRAISTAALLSVAFTGPAMAHGGGASFGSGFVHPIAGLDHILAMLAVGVLALQVGGRGVWALPVSFVGMMTVGGLVGFAGFNLPYFELGIVGSVIVLGAVLALGKQLPVAGATVMVGLFAIFHGFAHGVEMPTFEHGLYYGSGFAVATAVLHGAGLAAALGVKRFNEKLAPEIMRFTGVALAGAGVALAVS